MNWHCPEWFNPLPLAPTGFVFFLPCWEFIDSPFLRALGKITHGEGAD